MANWKHVYPIKPSIAFSIYNNTLKLFRYKMTSIRKNTHIIPDYMQQY
jgi:hypothetical protein